MINPNYDFHDLGTHDDDDLERAIDEGFTFGGYSSADNDMFLISRDAPTPSEKEITESVPYMQGVYDFSMLGNERFFDNREVTYQVMLFGSQYSDRKITEQDLKRQLMMQPIQAIYDTHDRGYHWVGKCKSVNVEDDEEKHTLSATIVFDCMPFARANDLEGGDNHWDDVYFPNWYFQRRKYTVDGTQSIFLMNIGAHTVDVKMVVTGKVTVSGDFGTLEMTDGNYTNTQLTIKVGSNDLLLSGKGTIEFQFYREEMI